MRWLVFIVLVVMVALGLQGLWQLRPRPPVYKSPEGAYTLTLPVRWRDNYLVALNPSQSSFPEAHTVVTFWTKPLGPEPAMPLFTLVSYDTEDFKLVHRRVELPAAHLQLASNGRYDFMAYFPESNPYAPYTRAAQRFDRLVLTPIELAEGFKPIMMEPLKPQKKNKKRLRRRATAPKTVIEAPKTVIDAPKIATPTPSTSAPVKP